MLLVFVPINAILRQGISGGVRNRTFQAVCGALAVAVLVFTQSGVHYYPYLQVMDVVPPTIRSAAIGGSGDLYLQLPDRIVDLAPSGTLVASNSAAAQHLCWDWWNAGILGEAHCYAQLVAVDARRNVTVSETTASGGGPFSSSSYVCQQKMYSWLGQRLSRDLVAYASGPGLALRDRAGNRYELLEINTQNRPEGGYRVLKITPRGKRTYVQAP
jgi:hypothetical protein